MPPRAGRPVTAPLSLPLLLGPRWQLTGTPTSSWISPRAGSPSASTSMGSRGTSSGWSRTTRAPVSSAARRGPWARARSESCPSGPRTRRAGPHSGRGCRGRRGRPCAGLAGRGVGAGTLLPDVSRLVAFGSGLGSFCLGRQSSRDSLCRPHRAAVETGVNGG